MRNALTVDVEEYFHVSAFSSVIDRRQWGTLQSRVESNTGRLLELFDSDAVKATFFVLGWVADRYPNLVRTISAQGHEVACHGWSHDLVYRQTPAVFREETVRAKALLEDLAGAPVEGYRAASYSITGRSLWALDVLAEAGFRYDSSIFPIRHDRYGMPAAPRFPHARQTQGGRAIVEFPLSTLNLAGFRLPVAGGGYFRLFPYAVTRLGVRASNRRHQPFAFYLHPWEIDPDQPRVAASPLSRFRHYNNLHRCEGRLRRLLADFEFTTMRAVLVEHGVLPADRLETGATRPAAGTGRLAANGG